MRVVLQRVSSAHVSICGKIIGQIQKGYVLLLGVKDGDSEKEVDLLVQKIIHLRVMSDDAEKMNKSILDVNGEVLVVSQFTLYADLSSGRRPSFMQAAKPEDAKKLYQYFINKLKISGIQKVQTGEFGANMEVQIINDGPVTIVLDSDEFTSESKTR